MWMLLSQGISNSELKVATERQSRKECRKDASACLITSVLQALNQLTCSRILMVGRLSSSLQVAWKFLVSGFRHIVTSLTFLKDRVNLVLQMSTDIRLILQSSTSFHIQRRTKYVLLPIYINQLNLSEEIICYCVKHSAASFFLVNSQAIKETPLVHGLLSALKL